MENKTAKTILQEPISVTIRGKEVKVQQPTLATLIKVSAKIAELPDNHNENDYVRDVLRSAKDGEKIAEILSFFIVGASRKTNIIKEAKRRIIKSRILYDYNTSELWEIFLQILKGLQVADFFALITSLSAVNITKMTQAETTAPGQ